MKKHFLAGLVALFFFSSLQAQYCGGSGSSICTPGGPYANPGFYPDYNAQPCFVKNAFSELYVDLQIPLLLNGVTIDSIKIDSIGNLPIGLCWRMGHPNNVILGGGTGCIQVSGTPTGVPGQYKMHVSGTAWSSIGVFPNLNIEQFSFKYFLRMVCDSQSVCPTVDINAGAFINTGYDQSCVPVAKLKFVYSADSVNEPDGNVLVNYVKVQSLTNGSQTVDVVRKTGDAADLSGFNVQTLTFNSGGPDSLPFFLNLNNDALIEGDEVIQFVLRNASGSGQILADSLFDLTILDDDTANSTIPELSFSTDTVWVMENDTTFQLPVNILNQSNDTVRVSIGTGIGNALNTADYSFSPTLLTFLPNMSTPQHVAVTIIEDQFVEGNEFTTLILYNATNGAVLGSPSGCVIVIQDEDVIGVNEMTEGVVRLYPNPAQSSIAISGCSPNEVVRIYNAVGELVLKTHLPTSGRLDVSNLTMGLYLLEVDAQHLRWQKQ